MDENGLFYYHILVHSFLELKPLDVCDWPTTDHIDLKEETGDDTRL